MRDIKFYAILCIVHIIILSLISDNSFLFVNASWPFAAKNSKGFIDPSIKVELEGKDGVHPSFLAALKKKRRRATSSNQNNFKFTCT